MSKIKAKIKVGTWGSSALVIFVLLGLAVSVLVSGGKPSAVLSHCTGYGGEAPCTSGLNPFHGPDDLNGNILGGPDVGSWGFNSLEIIARGTDSKLYRKFYAANAYNGFFDIGGSSNADPTAVGTIGTAAHAYRVDFFVRGNDAEGALFHGYVIGTTPADATFKGWEKVGGRIIGGPDSAVRFFGGLNHQLSAFARGLDNALWQIYWDGFQWIFNRIGGTLASDPSAIGDETIAARIDVFYRGTDGRLKHRYWNGSIWTPVEDLGGQIIGAPDALSRQVNGTLVLEAFVRGTDSKLYRKVWNGSSWGGFEFVGQSGFTSTSDPGAISWDINKRADVVWRGPTGSVQHTWKP